RRIAAVRKRDIVECHLATHFTGLYVERIRLILNLDGYINIFKYHLKESQRPLNLNLYTEQLTNRKKKATLQRRKGDQFSQRHRRVERLTDDLPAFDEVDNSRH